MKLGGLELARNVHPDERASHGLPVNVSMLAPRSIRGIVSLKHRVVIAWSERISYVPRLIPTELSEVVTAKRKSSRNVAEREAITLVTTDRRIDFILYSHAQSLYVRHHQ